jgi:DNA-nicking Smr family endonuclease
MRKYAIIVLNENNSGGPLKKKENQLSPEDQALFRQAMRQVKPLTPAKVRQKPVPPPLKVRPKPLPEEVLLDAPFSDNDYLDLVDSEDGLEYAQPGFSNKLLRELKRGIASWEARLDLHGKTVEEARQALQQFIAACCRQDKTLVLIIHGKGHSKTKPILKNKLNHWLRESEAVLAFCSAKKEDGGRGALYLRLKAKKTPSRKIPRGRSY